MVAPDPRYRKSKDMQRIAGEVEAGAPAAVPEVSRRAVLKYSAGGFALAFGGLILSACGSNSTKSATSPASTGESESSTPAVAGGRLTADEKKTLLKMAGPSNSSFTGKGMTWKIGAAFPYSGPYEYYEEIESDGLTLATQHIVQLGGPTFKVNHQNFGGTTGVDTQEAVDDMLNFKDTGDGVAVSGIQAALGALIPGAGRYKILDIDGGAGVGVFAGKPYYWAMRNNYPINNVTAAIKYSKATAPSAHSAIVVYNSGAAYAPVLNSSVAAVKEAGYTVTGTATQPEGSTDWSPTYASIQSQNPDIIVLVINGNDGAYFLRDFSGAGLKQPVYTFSYSEPQAKLAGNGFEGVFVVQESFLPDAPTNDWQSIFTKYYREEFTDQTAGPASPFNLSANYYNIGFVLWELASRVLAKKGDISKGDQLQAALQDDPNFPSIFGGSGMSPGAIRFDTTNHGLATSPLAVMHIQSGRPVLMASIEAEGSSGTGPLKLVSRS